MFKRNFNVRCYGTHVSMRIKCTTEKKEIKKQRKGKIIKGSAISTDTIQSKYNMSLIIVHKNHQFYLSKAGALASNPLDIRTRWDPTLDMKKI